MPRAAVSRALLGLFGLAVTAVPSLTRIGPVPPLGPFLDPVAGVWAVAGQVQTEGSLRATLPTLSRPVEVTVDDRGVPHIFAASEMDAYRVQGVVTGRDRLF